MVYSGIALQRPLFLWDALFLQLARDVDVNMPTAVQLPLCVCRQRRQQQALVLRRHAASGRVAVGAAEDHVRDHTLGVRAIGTCHHIQLWTPGQRHA